MINYFVKYKIPTHGLKHFELFVFLSVPIFFDLICNE